MFQDLSFGFRMLRRSPGSSLLAVMSHGLRLTLAGICAGAVVSVALTRLMGDLLYNVSPRDPEAFAWPVR